MNIRSAWCQPLAHAVLYFTSAAALHAADLYVATSGNDTTGTATLSQDFR